MLHNQSACARWTFPRLVNGREQPSLLMSLWYTKIFNQTIYYHALKATARVNQHLISFLLFEYTIWATCSSLTAWINLEQTNTGRKQEDDSFWRVRYSDYQDFTSVQNVMNPHSPACWKNTLVIELVQCGHRLQKTTATPCYCEIIGLKQHSHMLSIRLKKSARSNLLWS